MMGLTNATFSLTPVSRTCLMFMVIGFAEGAIHSCAQAVAPAADSVIVCASRRYEHPGIIKRFLLGNNYRKEWAQPVKMPVFDLRRVNGGMTILKAGGGLHTKSLRMITADNTEWVLRTVDKNVEKVLQPNYRHTFVQSFAQYMISASYPYAALVASGLSERSGVVSPKPFLFYVPDDTLFGIYRKDFAGQVCFLEQRNPVIPNTTPEGMKHLLEEMAKDNHTIVLQKQVLKARLLDMIIGDWDRHEGQWRWGKYDSAGMTCYYPVPVDRDQAFFRTHGLLMKAINLTATPYLKGFTHNIRGMVGFNRWVWNVDRVFLNELSAEDWVEMIRNVQTELSDSAIRYAVNKLPPEISAADADKIYQTLRSRRDGLMPAAMDYYSFLSRSVYIGGTRKTEIFKVRDQEGQCEISVYSHDPGGNERKIYQRTFYKNETKTVYLVGADKVDRGAGRKSKPKLVLVQSSDKHKFDLRQKLLDHLEDKQ